jgi:hypothetical protein
VNGPYGVHVGCLLNKPDTHILFYNGGINIQLSSLKTKQKAETAAAVKAGSVWLPSGLL